MRNEKSWMLGGALLLAVFAFAAFAYASSSAQIYVGGCGLQYVKHVNNLPSGNTTLWVRNNGGEQRVRIKFSARAADGTNVFRTIDASLRSREERPFAVAWGKEITDLNFIQIIPTTSCKKDHSSSSGV